MSQKFHNTGQQSALSKPLKRLTYRKLGDTSQLEAMAQEIEKKFKKQD